MADRRFACPWIVAASLLAACHPAEPRAGSAAEPSAPPPDSPSTHDEQGTVVGCPEGERLEIAAGTTATTSTGLAVTFAGSSIDHYEDGSWALLLELGFAREAEQASRIFSANATPREESILGHCVVLVEPGEERVVVRAGREATARAGAPAGSAR
jgi:hypothetical protein